jgi:hypothetical protein
LEQRVLLLLLLLLLLAHAVTVIVPWRSSLNPPECSTTHVWLWSLQQLLLPLLLLCSLKFTVAGKPLLLYSVYFVAV